MKNLSSVRLLLSKAVNIESAKDFIREYNRIGRWSHKADELFKQAFPSAYFSNNVGWNKGKSGTVRIDKSGNVYVHKYQSAVSTIKNGWKFNFNRSRAWVIPA